MFADEGLRDPDRVVDAFERELGPVGVGGLGADVRRPALAWPVPR